MKIEYLVKMANEVGGFFASEPDPEQAVNAVAGHLRRFWEPRMRTAIYAYLDQHHGEGLHPLALETLRTRAADLRPRPKPTPAST